MPNTWFRFKQFTIHQDGPVFPVGTDGVLLGSWADVTGVETVLDIGTGTGLIALMIAQRSGAKITAVEIDKSSSDLARKNFSNSPWIDRLSIINSAIQDFKPTGKFDLITCNPPFFQDSKLPLKDNLAKSKHNVNLLLEEIAALVSPLLNHNGRFCCILPPDEAQKIAELFKESDLHLFRVLNVRPRAELSFKRVLLDFRFQKVPEPVVNEISIEKKKRHDYTPEYINLTKHFYLKF